jgi:hypothetical protein
MSSIKKDETTLDLLTLVGAYRVKVLGVLYNKRVKNPSNLAESACSFGPDIN